MLVLVGMPIAALTTASGAAPTASRCACASVPPAAAGCCNPCAALVGSAVRLPPPQPVNAHNTAVAANNCTHTDLGTFEQAITGTVSKTFDAADVRGSIGSAGIFQVTLCVGAKRGRGQWFVRFVTTGSLAGRPNACVAAARAPSRQTSRYRSTYHCRPAVFRTCRCRIPYLPAYTFCWRERRRLRWSFGAAPHATPRSSGGIAKPTSSLWGNSSTAAFTSAAAICRPTAAT